MERSCVLKRDVFIISRYIKTHCVTNKPKKTLKNKEIALTNNKIQCARTQEQVSVCGLPRPKCILAAAFCLPLNYLASPMGVVLTSLLIQRRFDLRRFEPISTSFQPSIIRRLFNVDSICVFEPFSTSSFRLTGIFLISRSDTF